MRHSGLCSTLTSSARLESGFAPPSDLSASRFVSTRPGPVMGPMFSIGATVSGFFDVISGFVDVISGFDGLLGIAASVLKNMLLNQAADAAQCNSDEVTLGQPKRMSVST
jgi:hypothetical protein